MSKQVTVSDSENDPKYFRIHRVGQGFSIYLRISLNYKNTLRHGNQTEELLTKSIFKFIFPNRKLFYPLNHRAV